MTAAFCTPAPAEATKSIDDLPWHIRRDADGAWAEKPPRKVAVVTQTTSEMDEVIAFVNELTALALPRIGFSSSVSVGSFFSSD